MLSFMTLDEELNGEITIFGSYFENISQSYHIVKVIILRLIK